MLPLIAALALSLMFALGSLYTVAPMPAILLGGIVVSVLGVLHARWLRLLLDNYRGDSIPAQGNELTLVQLCRETVTRTEDTVVFLENPFRPARGWFSAVIGGRRVIVIEGGQ